MRSLALDESMREQLGETPGKVFSRNFRHLFVRAFFDFGKDIAKLAGIFGHNNSNTTRIYIFTTGADHKRKMKNVRLKI